MSTKKLSVNENEQMTALTSSSVSRRSFLSYVGAGSALLATAGIMSSCDKDDNPSNGGVNLGSGDVGILNYAYALEQLEAAFYQRVIATPYSGISALEMEYMSDIRNHEVGHREFFKAAITAAAPSMIIPDLEVDFSTINFADRTSVLGAAKAFEDLGVKAYNGAGKLISTTGNGPTYLLLAGKIVSVEARHAALIADLISNGTFAAEANANPNGLDAAFSPSQVLQIAGTYIKTKIDASNLPS